ncbi:hypothetical protein ANO14919_078890 [Xylariales sp. No.14919]|nr:hypothetical protein ANO14919_078890 [Xylariales sp. No.14919]
MRRASYQRHILSLRRSCIEPKHVYPEPHHHTASRSNQYSRPGCDCTGSVPPGSTQAKAANISTAPRQQ